MTAPAAVRKRPRVRTRFVALTMAVLLGAVFAPAIGAAPREALVAGRLERVRISPGELVVEATLDTGAHTSSLHAENVQRFKRDGLQWIAFEVRGEDGRVARLERPLVRVSRVRSALGSDGARPVVRLGLCVGTVYRAVDVSLVDRSGLKRPLLVGRTFLRDRVLVDSGRRHLTEPACPTVPAP
jgi:hypothetical protein